MYCREETFGLLVCLFLFWIHGGLRIVSLKIAMFSLILDVKVHFMNVQINGGQETVSSKMAKVILIVDVKVHL